LFHFTRTFSSASLVESCYFFYLSSESTLLPLMMDSHAHVPTQIPKNSASPSSSCLNSSLRSHQVPFALSSFAFQAVRVNPSAPTPLCSLALKPSVFLFQRRDFLPTPSAKLSPRILSAKDRGEKGRRVLFFIFPQTSSPLHMECQISP